MLNSITLAGRIVKDPELRTTQSGVSVASYTVAVERDFQQGGEKKTDFVRVVSWRQTAEFVGKYFHKGSLIILSGRLESRQWEDKDGQKRAEWEVVADHVYFGGEKKRDAAPKKEPSLDVSAGDFEEPEGLGGDLPF